jgi:hypothetical protein
MATEVASRVLQSFCIELIIMDEVLIDNASGGYSNANNRLPTGEKPRLQCELRRRDTQQAIRQDSNAISGVGSNAYNGGRSNGFDNGFKQI